MYRLRKPADISMALITYNIHSRHAVRAVTRIYIVMIHDSCQHEPIVLHCIELCNHS